MKLRASNPESLQRAIAETGAVIKYRFPWWLRPFLLRGVAGITLGRRIYIEGANPESILRHELVHVRQIQRLGLVRFYWTYIREYAANLRGGLSSAEAYRRISLEEEAFAAECREIL
ncbi:MAG: hypothetical protein DMF58_12505 [Acidobacteria bacterium]|nr:MAG: hypothetical protein DMF58_12505 [Acidobacteriota bacterium]